MVKWVVHLIRSPGVLEDLVVGSVWSFWHSTPFTITCRDEPGSGCSKSTTISRHSVLGVEGTGQLHCTYTDQRLTKVRYQVRVMKCKSPCESGVRLIHCECPCASGVRRMECESPGATLRHKHCESPCASGVRRMNARCLQVWALLKLIKRISREPRTGPGGKPGSQTRG